MFSFNNCPIIFFVRFRMSKESDEGASVPAQMPYSSDMEVAD